MAIVSSLTVENRGIHDILGYISSATQEDVLTEYDFMQCTSRNHIRWFFPELLTVTYTPQSLSQEMYDEIINSPLFQCR